VLNRYSRAERGVSCTAPAPDPRSKPILKSSTSSVSNIARDCRIAAECWAAASRIALDGFELKTDCAVTKYPHRYFEEDGKEMWDRVRQLIAA
jgi:hypothetical protein